MFFLIFFFPLLNFFLLSIFGNLIGFFGAVFISIFFLFFLFILVIILLLFLLKYNLIILFNFNFKLFFFDIILNWSFTFDSLTCCMLVLISFVSLLVHLYSSQYM